MSLTATRRSVMPDVTRPDVRAIYLSHWYVPDPDRGRAVLDEIADVWERTPWPVGMLTFSCYLSSGGDTVLTYTQCSRDDVYRRFVRSLPVAAARVEPVEYRLAGSVLLSPAAGPPAAVVTASFDVDGPERQRFIVDSVSAHLRRAPADEYAGLIASHFHVSVDGTRVINFAEWISDETHETFLEGATRYGALRIANETPGVRPIGYTRYGLYRGLDG